MASLARQLRAFMPLLPGSAAQQSRLVTSLVQEVLVISPIDFDSSYHGVDHWARVLRNAQRISSGRTSGRSLLGAFALIHDSHRQDEGQDPEHGPRAAEWMQANRKLFDLTDIEFRALECAVRYHSDGYTEPSDTGVDLPNRLRWSVGMLWDADRLDLPRCGVVVSADRLCTDEARAMIEPAHSLVDRSDDRDSVLRPW